MIATISELLLQYCPFKSHITKAGLGRFGVLLLWGEAAPGSQPAARKRPRTEMEAEVGWGASSSGGWATQNPCFNSNYHWYSYHGIRYRYLLIGFPHLRHVLFFGVLVDVGEG